MAKFDSYISMLDAIEGVNQGKLFRGVLRVNKKKPDDAFVKSENSNCLDCMIKGRQNRNRAIHGDTVIYEIIEPPSKPSKETNNITNEYASSSDDENNLMTIKANNTSQGKVVYVESYDGSLKEYVSYLFSQNRKSLKSNEQETLFKAVPLDKRIPWIMIPNSEIDKFKINKINLNSQNLYLITITQWDENYSSPKGIIIRSIGSADSLDAIVLGCLSSHNLNDHSNNFNSLIEIEIKNILKISEDNEIEKELDKRIDLREKLVFTIDPSTAKDLDDAIHIQKYKNFFEIGIHISDVSHYIKRGSSIDIEAKKRCTTVYMTNKSFPMLPSELSSNLCSLNPNEDKLTYSVIFFVDISGHLIGNPQFFKSIIRSRFKLTYEQAYDIIKGNLNDFDKNLIFDENFKTLNSNIYFLHKITQSMRKERLDNGSLTWKNVRFKFSIEDQELKDFHFVKNNPANELIEELMLRANVYVATKLANSELACCAVLRRHPPPITNMIDNLTKLASNLDVKGDFHKEMNKMLTKINKKFGNYVENAFKHFIAVANKPAEYFVYTNNTQNTHHYALNFPLYTHFTSPIRRYADVMVHRLLYIIQTSYDIKMEPNDLNKSMLMLEHTTQCTLCNVKRNNARLAGLDCDWAFFCLFLKNSSSIYATTAVITNICETFFEVYLPYLDKTTKIAYKKELCNFAKLNTSSKDLLIFPFKVANENHQKFTIYWPDMNNDSKLTSYNLFSSMNVFILLSNEHKNEILAVVFHPKLSKEKNKNINDNIIKVIGQLTK